MYVVCRLGGGFTTMLNLETGEDELVVMAEMPPAPQERVLAVRALSNALAHSSYSDMLRGVLWWKVSMCLCSPTKNKPDRNHLSRQWAREVWLRCYTQPICNMT